MKMFINTRLVTINACLLSILAVGALKLLCFIDDVLYPYHACYDATCHDLLIHFPNTTDTERCNVNDDIVHDPLILFNAIQGSEL